MGSHCAALKTSIEKLRGDATQLAKAQKEAHEAIMFQLREALAAKRGLIAAESQAKSAEAEVRAARETLRQAREHAAAQEEAATQAEAHASQVAAAAAQGSKLWSLRSGTLGNLLGTSG